MKNYFFFLLLFIFPLMSNAQELTAFQLFDIEGRQVSFGEMVQALQDAEVIFFGEQHNNPIAHWMQLELTRALHEEAGEQLVLGAEMFEADNQLLLDEYLGGLISESNFEKEARLWNNYMTDYKPLVLFAKKNDLNFVATNIPRRYANLVYHEGMEALEQLSPEAKAYIAPLPVEVPMELPCYKNMMSVMGGHGDGSPNLIKAQAIKDATMAHFIHNNRREGHLLLHYNGSYHSDHKEGIAWYLNQYKPGVRIKNIATVEQVAVDTLEEEHLGKADFILCVPANMTKTY
jgi:uncharacterized iron-regulated protein